jgi:hypothetical protein
MLARLGRHVVRPWVVSVADKDRDSTHERVFTSTLSGSQSATATPLRKRLRTGRAYGLLDHHVDECGYLDSALGPSQ